MLQKPRFSQVSQNFQFVDPLSPAQRYNGQIQVTVGPSESPGRRAKQVNRLDGRVISENLG